MEIAIILKIAGVGILTAVVNQILSKCGKDEVATFTTLAGVIIVIMMVIEMISKLFDTVQTLFNLY